MDAGPGKWTLGNYRRCHIHGYGVNRGLANETKKRHIASYDTCGCKAGIL